MKFFIGALLLFLASFSNGQSQVICKSGQIINFDGANNFMNSNKDSLVNRYADLNIDDKFAMAILLNNELINKIEYVTLKKNLAILEYDIKRTEKSKRIDIKAEIKKIKQQIKQNSVEYKLIEKQLSEYTSKNLKQRELTTKKVLGISEKTDTIISSNSKTVDTLQVAEPPLIQVIDENPVIMIDSTARDSATVIGAPELKTDKPAKAPKEKKPKKKDVKTINDKPKLNCTLEFKGKNPETGKKQLYVKKDILFAYTPEKMKNYYKLDDFLQGIVSMEKYDGKYFLNIECRFKSKDVQKSYGSILNNDFLRIEFLNGKKVFLKASKVEEPYIEKHTANTIYKVKYFLENSENIDQFENEFIDTIGIMWSTGFESYMVHNVDFLIQQMQCLNDGE